MTGFHWLWFFSQAASMVTITFLMSPVIEELFGEHFGPFQYYIYQIIDASSTLSSVFQNLNSTVMSNQVTLLNTLDHSKVKSEFRLSSLQEFNRKRAWPFNTARWKRLFEITFKCSPEPEHNRPGCFMEDFPSDQRVRLDCRSFQTFVRYVQSQTMHIMFNFGRYWNW